jgi:RhtB (resistance to homoserine/threonine) family protein
MINGMYISAILTVALLHFLAVVSPGPDFIMISRNALVYSRRSGVYAALGLALGILVHITYSLVGIGLIIAKSLILFSILKFIGAGYLLYTGYKAFRSKESHLAVNEISQQKHMTKMEAIRMGFITNATNPKATLFFLSLFTLVISPKTPLSIKLIMGAEMSLVTFLWFAFVATILSHGLIRKRFVRVQHYVERVMGVLLIALGIKLALSTNN